MYRDRPGKRDRKRSARKTTIAALMRRFEFTPSDLQDSRIARLLARKEQLDLQIAELLHAGHREERIRQFAAVLGFSSAEFANDPRIAWAIQSVFDARRYLAGLQPIKPQPQPAAREE